ncbi:MAG: hypothetical protein HOV79_26140, partial [Hamadaea sp.]|nr:hypothetical protein [Hamadaea sp.]
PAVAQGAGQVDVAAAVRRVVRADVASVGFGRIAWTGADRPDATATVTYRNDGASAVTLDLAAAAAADGSPGAALTVSPSRLTVPARGTASTVLRLDPDRTPGGAYTGQLVATSGEGSVHVPIGFAVDGETVAVTVHATARDGRAPGAFSQAQLWNLDTGELHREIVGADPAVLRVAPGRYALMVYAFTADSGDWPRELTVLGDPELTVRGDRTLRFDARTASEIRVRTPEDAQVRDVIIAWQRVVGEKSIVTGFGLNPRITTRFFAAPTQAVTTGSFEFTSHVELAEPPLTATAPGLVLTPAQVHNTPAFDGRRRLPVIDGDRSLSGARGAAVLLRASSGEPADARLAAAQAAGAALVLLHSGDDVYFEPWTEGAGVPAYGLQHDAAQALLRRLADRRPATLEVTATPQSPYTYQLLLPERGRIPASLTYDTRRLPMATVETQVHDLGAGAPANEGRYAITPTALAAYSAFRVIPTPLRRTDHLTTGRPGAEVTWRQEASADLSGWFPNGTMSGLPRTYRAGERARDVWFSALTRPAIPAVTPAYAYGAPANRAHDALRIAIPQFATGTTTQYGWLSGGDTAQLTLHRDGVLVGSTTASTAQFTVPSGAAGYRLRLDVSRDQPWWTTSTETSSTWTFRSARPTTGVAVLPLLQLDYAIDTDLRNTIDADRGYALVIRPGHQPGASGPAVVTRAEVSYDGGVTWLTVTRRHGDTFSVPGASGDGFATLRVSARDRDGNTLDQTIVRAWRVDVDRR